MIGRVIDFGAQSDFLLALLPETVLALTAIAVLLGDVIQRGSDNRKSEPWVAVVSLVGIGLAVGANVLLGTFDVQNEFSMIAIDGFHGSVFVVTAIGVQPCSAHHARNSLSEIAKSVSIQHKSE